MVKKNRREKTENRWEEKRSIMLKAVLDFSFCKTSDALVHMQ